MLAWAVLASLLARPTQGYISGAFVLPHGSIALGPEHWNASSAEARAQGYKVHDACVAVGQEIAALRPDVILLSTPHGVTDLERFMLYLGPTAEGRSDAYCLCPPCCDTVSVTLDGDGAMDLITHLKDTKLGAMTSAFGGYGPPGAGPGSPFPLRWGEVIPISFIPPEARAKAKFLILSQPSRRVAEAVTMNKEELALGAALADYLEALPQRVVVLISADGGHAHIKDGPYGFHKHAEKYDELSCKWAGTLSLDVLTRQAAAYVPEAKTCGYTGLVLLQGLLTQLGLEHWVPKCLASEHPDYYGMLVGSIKRVQNAQTAEL